MVSFVSMSLNVILFVNLWKVARQFERPKSMDTYLNNPLFVKKRLFYACLAIQIYSYMYTRLILINTDAKLNLSSKSAILGERTLSNYVLELKALNSIDIWSSPILFLTRSISTVYGSTLSWFDHMKSCQLPPFSPPTTLQMIYSIT